jgi:hypothetical protein
MPVAFTVRLRAEGPLLAETRHVHGLACSLFETQDTAHEGGGKPFSIWPIAHHVSRPGEALWLASWLPPAAPPAAMETLVQVRLGAQPFRICGIERAEAGHGELRAGARRGDAGVQVAGVLLPQWRR